MLLTDIKNFLSENNYPSFRYKQIEKNYNSGRYKNFLEMSDLPKDLREILNEKFQYISLIEDKFQSELGTKKALLKLSDGLEIETVLMDYDQWITACLSTQIGCSLNCKFCATGKMGFKRNLTTEELLDQIRYWNIKIYPKYIGRIVFMGMGEPFLNYDNLMESLKHIDIGARKISISTAGIVPKIIEFANLKTQINLAISLHSIFQKTREEIMPIAKTYKLEELINACHYYTKTTNRQLFFEYALIKNVNDSQRDLDALISFIKSNKLFYLNLIPLNSVDGSNLKSSEKLKLFETELTKKHINFSIRRSFGQKIDAACGQLAYNTDIC
jgi:23S rRNA (adenine2503-C2)-methyltransferase